MSAAAALVTGASSGIGRATALRLANDGFEVFAGVRSAEDAESARSAGLHALLFDVTDHASIDVAAAEIAEATGDRGLAALVNNAGIAVPGPVEHVPPARWREQLEVNVIGQVAVTQACLPLLRRGGGGRIVFVSSIGGRVAIPLNGPYVTSKFAVEGLADSLRREVADQGVGVIVIEPGAIATEIWGKAVEDSERMRAEIGDAGMRRYGELISSVMSSVDEFAAGNAVPPEDVAAKISHALTSSRPRARYVIGRDAKARALAARVLPDRVMDSLIARALRP